MKESKNEKSLMDEVAGQPVRSENLGFDPGAMLACAGCGRLNPPNRLACLYCSHATEVAEEFATQIKPNLRSLEPWEKGFNVIATGRSVDIDNVSGAAKLLSTDEVSLRSILEVAYPMPIARVESQADAQVIADSLGRFGIDCFVISDDSLMPDRPPIRLRAIDFGDADAAFIEFNTGGRTLVSPEDLVLIVPGIIAETKTEQLKKKGRRGSSNLVDETETSSDEAVLDVYSRHDATGFRIMPTGFDFSCLAGNKGLLAADNLRRLADRLTEFAPNASVVNAYPQVRSELSSVWEIERRKDSHGLKRSSFARFGFGNTSLSSNASQLNKFSRLQWHLR